jgi:hypothetical protein
MPDGRLKRIRLWIERVAARLALSGDGMGCDQGCRTIESAGRAILSLESDHDHAPVSHLYADSIPPVSAL